MAPVIFELYLTFLCVVFRHPLLGWHVQSLDEDWVTVEWQERRCPCGMEFEVGSLVVEIDESEESGAQGTMDRWLG